MNVSVIIPNYCHARFLNRRIDSVLNQTYDDFEVIILDDCSTDNSRDIIETYRHHPRVSHIVYNEKNSGSTFVQWDKGFELAQGQYIWIAESDDFAEPDFLASCVEQLDREPSCTLAYTESRLVDAESHPMKKRMKKAYSRGEVCDMWEGNAFIIANMLRCNTIYNASMVVFRKDARPTNEAYKKYRYVGDWLFWVGLLLNGDAVYIDKPLDYFRQHPGNTTATTLSSGNNYKEFGNLISDICQTVDHPFGFKAYLYGYFWIHLHRHLEKQHHHSTIVKEIFREWRGNGNPTFSIVWYRLAKILHIYRDEKPYMP